MTTERLRINAEDLIDLLVGSTRERLIVVFNRARRELDYYPSVAAIRKLAGAMEEVEARAAWDQVEKFVQKYVDFDLHGNCGPQYGWHKDYPKLSNRILNTVRMIGGWKMLKRIAVADFPFVQKRFFEAYEYADDVDQYPIATFLEESKTKQLKEQ